MNMHKAPRLIKRPIILSIETKVREFPGKVLLSCFLAEHGFSVILTNHRRWREVNRHSAWLFIDRNTFVNRIPFFTKLKKSKVKIACLDEEGIVWANPGIYQRRLNQKSMGMTDLFFTWGKKQTELVTRLNKNTKVLETGNPRMDLLRPELRALYQGKADKIIKQYGNFILIVSNFAWNNHYYINNSKECPTDAYIKLLKRQGQILTAQDKEFHLANLKYKARVFEKLKDLVNYLSIRFPELSIIVRPHPSENHDEWRNSITNLKNVKILFEGELEPWIIAARAVIHNSCTSGVLAALLNRKSIAYMPYNDSRFEHEMPNSVSAQAFTEEEVADLIQNSPISQDVPELLKEYISSSSGSFAAEKIANAIKEAYSPFISETVTIAYLNVRKLLKKMRKKITKSDNSAGTDREELDMRRNYKDQKFDRITIDEIRDYIAVYSKLLNRFSNIVPREIDDTFEIKLSKEKD